MFIAHHNMCVCVLWQAWADAFRSSPDLTGVVHIYEELKRRGIEFPMADLDALSPIHTPQRVSRKKCTHSANTFGYSYNNIYKDVFVLQGTPEVDPATIKYLAPASPAVGTPKPSPPPASDIQVPHVPSPITATPEQVRGINSNL